MRQNMGAGFGKCLGQGKDKNGEQQQISLSERQQLQHTMTVLQENLAVEEEMEKRKGVEG